LKTIELIIWECPKKRSHIPFADSFNIGTVVNKANNFLQVICFDRLA
jgi:hypothetical protein